jgi:hypothetical protein
MAKRVIRLANPRNPKQPFIRVDNRSGNVRWHWKYPRWDNQGGSDVYSDIASWWNSWTQTHHSIPVIKWASCSKAFEVSYLYFPTPTGNMNVPGSDLSDIFSIRSIATWIGQQTGVLPSRNYGISVPVSPSGPKMVNFKKPCVIEGGFAGPIASQK